jgi:Restriction endonuclease S subunits
MYPKYIYLVLECNETRRQIENPIRTTSGVKNINSTEISNLKIPLAPLGEQIQIITKVDELMKLCDELEEQIRQSKEESERLLQAVLREAFEGKDVEESNAEVSVA